MSNDILFLAEFSAGAPARSALELATGAAELASQSGGAAVGLAYGPGAAAGAAQLGAHGAARAIVLGDDERPAIGYAPSALAAARDAGLALLAPATPNGRDLAAALVGGLGLPAFGPVRAVRVVDGDGRNGAGDPAGIGHHHLPPGRERTGAVGRARAREHVHPGGRRDRTARRCPMPRAPPRRHSTA